MNFDSAITFRFISTSQTEQLLKANYNHFRYQSSFLHLLNYIYIQ